MTSTKASTQTSPNPNSRSMTLLKSIFLLIGLGMIAALVACSSSNSSSTPQPTIAVTAATGTTPQSATVGNAFATALAVTVTSGGSPASGVSVTFTAPSSGASGVFGNGTATETDTTNSSGVATISSTFTANTTAGAYAVTASATGSSTPASFSLTNTSGAAAAIAVSSGNNQTAAISSAFSTPLAALVTDSDGNPVAGASVTFTVTAGSGGANASFATSGATDTENTGSNGIATTSQTLTGNATIGSFSVSADFAGDTSGAPATFTLANIAAALPPLGAGNYVFNLAGENTAGNYYYFVTGVFSVNSAGAITGGEQDFTDYSGNPEEFDSIASGAITTTADGNLQIILTTCTATDCTTPDSAVGVGGVETLNASMIDATDYFIDESDTSATGSGQLNFQTATSQPCTAFPCGYAFFLNGGDGSSNGLGSDIGGVVAVTSSGTISGTGSVVDINDGGVVSQDQPVASPSSVGSPDLFGRFSIDLTLGGSSGFSGIGLVGYIIDSTRVRLIENGNDPVDQAPGFFGVTGGTALAQGGSTGTFDAASIEGTSFVFRGNGQDDTPNYFQVAGVLTTNLDGSSVSGTLNANDLTGSGVQAPEPFTGTYTVDSTGRVTLSLGIGSGVTMQMYLSGGDRNFVASMDSGDYWAGPSFVQTTPAGSYSASNFSGTYAFDATGYQLATYGNEFDAVGTLTASGTTVTGTVDENVLFGTLTSGIGLTDGFTANANGIFTGTITGLDLLNGTQDSFTYYLIDSSGDSVAIETDPNQLTLGYIQLQ